MSDKPIAGEPYTTSDQLTLEQLRARVEEEKQELMEILSFIDPEGNMVEKLGKLYDDLALLSERERRAYYDNMLHANMIYEM